MKNNFYKIGIFVFIFALTLNFMVPKVDAANISIEQLIKILIILNVIDEDQSDLVRTILSSKSSSRTPSATLKVSKSEIDSGGTAFLTWNSLNAVSCSGVGGNFDTNGKTNGASPVSPTVTTTYKLECENNEGVKIQSSVTVKVNNPTDFPVAQIFTTDISKTNVVSYGGSTGILWQSRNAVSCEAISPDGFTANGPINSTWGSYKTGRLYEDTIYTIECKNSAGDKHRASVTVYVESIY